MKKSPVLPVLPTVPKQIEPEEEISIELSNPSFLIETLSLGNIGLTIQALNGLKPFVRASHINDLLDKGILEELSKLILDKKSSADIIEFSLYLLAELLNFKPAVNAIAKDEELILFVFLQFKTKPLAIQVPSLICLSYLSHLDNLKQILFEKCDLNLFFVRLTSPDPDLQSCILKILYNICQDINIAEKVVNLPGFGYKGLLSLLSSGYPVVQHQSLNLIEWFTSYDHLTTLREMLIDEGGIDVLMRMIETHKWPDLHEKVFKVLTNISELDIIYNKIRDEAIRKLVAYVNEIESQKLEYASYEAILKMSKKSTIGLNLFINNGLVNMVLDRLKGDQTDSLFNLSVTGMVTICEENTVLTTLQEDPDLIILMINILKSDHKWFDWTIKYNAALSTYLMVTQSQIFLETLLENKDWMTIIDLLIKYLKVAPYKLILVLANILKRMILEVYQQINSTGNYLGRLIGVIIQLMMDPTQRRPELKCVTTEIMELLIEFPQFRNKLKEKRVYRTLAKLLYRTTDNILILEAYLKLFITLAEWDSTFIDELIYIEAIQWFLNRTDIIRTLPMARRFVDLVFEKCKYIKIHFTNRLEMWDKIQTGFYLQRGPVKDRDEPFKSLKSIIREKDLKIRPTYYIDFDDLSEELLTPRYTVSSAVSAFDPGLLITSSSTTVSTVNSFLDGGDVNEECTVNVWDALKDPFLKLRLEELKLLLGYKTEKQVEMKLNIVLNRDEYVKKIEFLSEYVCNMMSSLGENLEEDCRNHSFELHLSEIKQDLGCPVIPLGYVKLGTKFERALLFKTLGDQLGIPSSLTRGSCGVGWNEVYLTPEAFNINQEDQSSIIITSGDNIGVTHSEISKRTSLMSDRKKSSNRLVTGRKSLKKTNSEKSISDKRSLIEKRQTRKTVPSRFTEIALEPDFPPPLWYYNAYQSYMNTNHVIDLENNPGRLIPLGTVEAKNYTSSICYVHPYFAHRTNIPPLIKRSTVP